MSSGVTSCHGATAEENILEHEDATCSMLLRQRQVGATDHAWDEDEFVFLSLFRFLVRDSKSFAHAVVGDGAIAVLGS